MNGVAKRLEDKDISVEITNIEIFKCLGRKKGLLYFLLYFVITFLYTYNSLHFYINL